MLKAAAFRANRLTVGIGPAYPLERLAGFGFRHAENLGQFQRAGAGGLKEVSGHLRVTMFGDRYMRLAGIAVKG